MILKMVHGLFFLDYWNKNLSCNVFNYHIFLPFQFIYCAMFFLIICAYISDIYRNLFSLEAKDWQSSFQWSTCFVKTIENIAKINTACSIFFV